MLVDATRGERGTPNARPVWEGTLIPRIMVGCREEGEVEEVEEGGAS